VTDLVKYQDAVSKIKNAILQSRYQAARLANREQLLLYYSIGQYVSYNTRSGKWGTGAIDEISRQLQLELPGLRGFSASNIKNMRIFFEKWVDIIDRNRQLITDDLKDADDNSNRQLPTDDLAGAQGIEFCHCNISEGLLNNTEMDAFMRVGFTHHTEILAKCKAIDERWYYIMRCASEFWTVEALKEHIRAKDYTRLGALPNNFALTIPNEKLAARAVRSFKDEYLLDYINIQEEDDPEIIDDRVLNKRIIANIRKFVIAFGEGFCPIGSHFRVIVEEEEFFVDILLFNRNLNCLVAIELKRGSFKPAYLGQLNFYLSALDEYVKKPHENKSIGLLLCKDVKKSIVELAVRDFNKPMGVATYRTLNNIPEEYQSLKPFISGVHEILSASDVDMIEPEE
jgi:predicted nuclease of restriction endonuclease-like (RecB) superfamily